MSTTAQILIDPTEKLHSVQGAADRLNVSHWTVRAWIKENKIAPVYAGARVLISESELQNFLQESTEAAQSRPRRVRKSAK